MSIIIIQSVLSCYSYSHVSSNQFKKKTLICFHIGFSLYPVKTSYLYYVTSLNPYNFDASTPTLDKAVVTNDNFPLSAIPMFATGSPEYCEAVYSTVVRVNVLYQEFLKSEEGLDFNGQVSTHFHNKV